VAEPEPAVVDTERRRPGRKRDSAVRGRIQEAAVDVFSTDGWRGFTLDAVARAAGVGKSTIYLRYATREELLDDILTQHGYQARTPAVDYDTIDEEFRAFAHDWAEWLDTPDGMLSIRISFEGRMNPDLGQLTRERGAAIVAETHGILKRGKRRGQLPATAPAAAILDALIGALHHHALSAPDRALYSTAHGRKFVDQIVDILLAGARATPPAPVRK
jgi:AcrR family transcriptional regulator